MPPVSVQLCLPKTLAPGEWERWRPRLQLPGIRCQHRAMEEVEPLDRPHLQTIFLIPAGFLSDRHWPRWRAALTRGNRLWVGGVTRWDSVAITQLFQDGANQLLSVEDSTARVQECLAEVVRGQELWWQLFGQEPDGAPSFLLGQSPALQSLRKVIQKMAPSSLSVLVQGESGTGKEVVARELHAKSKRKGPLVAVNCAAIPHDLMEAELFGVVRGAFTGAHADRPGLLEEAHQGTLFLDEIGEMATVLQPKLLRCLETRTVRRVGSRKEQPFDVRIISATNRPLEEAMEEHRFRPDLFYRLCELRLEMPPLRSHPEDIPLLALHFVKLSGERQGKLFTSIEPALAEQLMNHPWPGNVRELKSEMERLCLFSDGPLLRSGLWAAPEARPTGGVLSARSYVETPAAPLVSLNRKQRRHRAQDLLAESGGDVTWVAAQMGVHPSTIWRWQQPEA